MIPWARVSQDGALPTAEPGQLWAERQGPDGRVTRGLDISVLGDHLLLQPLALTGVRWWASARSTQVKLVERYLVGGTWPRLLSMTEGQLLCWSPPLMLTLVRGAQFSGTQEVECLGSPGLGLSLCFRRGSKSGHPYPQALGGYRRLSTHTQSWGLFPLTKGKLKPRCLPPPTFLSHTLLTHYCDTLGTGVPGWSPPHSRAWPALGRETRT